MVYNDFLNMVERARLRESQSTLVDIESFPIYVDTINAYLDGYFNSKASDIKTYDFLRRRAEGQTLEQIGGYYAITRERVRQIITGALDKLRNPNLVEGNKHLKGLYSFLLSIGENEIVDFIRYLYHIRHVVMLILDEKMYEQDTKYKRLVNTKQKRKKPKAKLVKTDEAKRVLKEFIERASPCCYSYSTIADILVKDYYEHNSFNCMGRLTWNRLVTILFNMELAGEIKRINCSTIIVC